MLKDRTTYEIIDPRKIGLSGSELVVWGKTMGRHGFKKRLEELGYKLSDEELERSFRRFKELADRKSRITDRDLEAIIPETIAEGARGYKLVSMWVETGSEVSPRARVKLVHNGKEEEAEGKGDGPVDAAFNAVDKIVKVKNKLLTFFISAVTGEKEALGEANLQLEVEDKVVSGRGVSTDIVEASVLAYLNALNKVVVGRS
jgi:2-isopropylmalate synthase